MEENDQIVSRLKSRIWHNEKKIAERARDLFTEKERLEHLLFKRESMNSLGDVHKSLRRIDDWGLLLYERGHCNFGSEKDAPFAHRTDPAYLILTGVFYYVSLAPCSSNEVLTIVRPHVDKIKELIELIQSRKMKLDDYVKILELSHPVIQSALKARYSLGGICEFKDYDSGILDFDYTQFGRVALYAPSPKERNASIEEVTTFN